MRGVVATTIVSMSVDGFMPASRRNFSASPSVEILSVSRNSVAPSGLVRRSVRCTTPTVTASFGTSESASFLAIAAGTASARSAAARNSFFI